MKKDDNYLYLKIRKEAFLNTIYNKRSWEDISIGFQNRQFRKPNKYNSDFWYHFSNKYVSKKEEEKKPAPKKKAAQKVDAKKPAPKKEEKKESWWKRFVKNPLR